LLNEASQLPPEYATDDTPPAVPTGLRSERSASASAVVANKGMGVQKDSIDELILDLNRLYGEQR